MIFCLISCLVFALPCDVLSITPSSTFPTTSFTFAAQSSETVAESCCDQLTNMVQEIASVQACHDSMILQLQKDIKTTSLGLMAGGYNYHQGGPTSHHCLIMMPEFATIPLPADYGLIHGSKYSTPVQGYHNVPCSICKARYSSTIMVPATLACPIGWTTQYQGYLMGGTFTASHGNEYICVDQALERMNGTEKGYNSDWLVHVAARCGSLPCPPYIDNAIMQCVVCSI